MEVEFDNLVKMTKTTRDENMSPSRQRHQEKKEVCEKILAQLVAIGQESTKKPGFAEELQKHFNRLPLRYALDVHTDRAEDVLTHKRLLHEARIPENRPAFHVRAVQILAADPQDEPMDSTSIDEVNGNQPLTKMRLALPVFGSSPNLEALANLDFNNKANFCDDQNDSNHSQSAKNLYLPMHEVTLSTIDRPKLLSQMSALLADVGLNILEAHVFSTTDGYSLNVFVVDGWKTEETQELTRALSSRLATIEKEAWAKPSLKNEMPVVPETVSHPDNGRSPVPTLPSNDTDDWEIDYSQLKFIQKVANGSFGDLFQGTYCGQDVAIKILKPERLNENLQREFLQEVFIMRKVRHKNVVQFIGACTMPPNLCIVTEFMSGGSVYDYLHKQKAVLKMPMLLRVAIDVSKGMDYLHQNKIIHRDLKAANLLMDENEVVKVADFGVARVQAQSGVMTAETGTYRWMAPEVCIKYELIIYEGLNTVYVVGVRSLQ
ncbi:hypothetical protein KC19_8G056800 [Ceratodon purpureus]|uniref:non-specific serine/threonine protein kinase n=1 Tax=Ceratodon purpureus TaxID=3225 RepID=A0A8T0H009_CERPU|nr:hypothetical protein KC19_8G056800 [Ceratodon purpureus]